MKKNRILPFLFAVTLFVGCKKMNGEYPPCEEMYAPEGLSVSWNEYNDVATFCNYFNCHPATIEEHQGDTIRVTGWLYYGEPGVDARVWHDCDLDYSPYIILTSNPTHFGYDSIVHIGLRQTVSDDSIWRYVRENINEFSKKQIYVSCIMDYSDFLPISGCCYRAVKIFAIDIKTDSDL